MTESIAVAVRVRPQQLPDLSASASAHSPRLSRKTQSASSSLPSTAAAAPLSPFSTLSSHGAAGAESPVLTIAEAADGKSAVVQVQPARPGAPRPEFIVDLVFDSTKDADAAAVTKETPAASAAGLHLQQRQLRPTTRVEPTINEKNLVSDAPSKSAVRPPEAAENQKRRGRSSSPPSSSAERDERATSAPVQELSTFSSLSFSSSSAGAPAASGPVTAAGWATFSAALPSGAAAAAPAVSEGVSSSADVSSASASAVRSAVAGDGTAVASLTAAAAAAEREEPAETQEHGPEREEEEAKEGDKGNTEDEAECSPRECGERPAATEAEEEAAGRRRERERTGQDAAATTPRWTGNSQANVFERTTRPLCDALLQGYNATVLAYGQTGSGKTYTIVGPSENPPKSDDETRGLLPRALQYLFSRLPSKTKGERRRGSQHLFEVSRAHVSSAAACAASGVESAVQREGDFVGEERPAAAVAATAADAIGGDAAADISGAFCGDASVLNDVVDWSMELQFVEIYQEQIYDLLAFPSSGSWSGAAASLEDILSGSSSSSSATTSGVGAAAAKQQQHAGGSGSASGGAAATAASGGGRGEGLGSTVAAAVSSVGVSKSAFAAAPGASPAGAGAGSGSAGPGGSLLAAPSFASLPLFSVAGAGGGGGCGSAAATPLKIRYDSHRRAAYVVGARKIPVHDEVSAMQVFTQGLRNRRTAETRMNLSSSRSHAVFSIQLHLQKRERQEMLFNGSSRGSSSSSPSSSTSQTAAAAKQHGRRDSCRKKLVAQLHIVDLAGSERHRDTSTSGDRLREAGKINYSLSVLSHVIRELAERSSSFGEAQQEEQSQQQQQGGSSPGGAAGAPAAAATRGGGGGGGTGAAAIAASRQSGGGRVHIPYRDSKLTFLLMDALGGSSKVCLIATVACSSKWLNETISTLQFAALSKKVKNKAVANEERVWDKAYVESMLQLHEEQKEELKRLRLLLQEKESAASASGNSSSNREGSPPFPAASAATSSPASAAAVASCGSLWELARRTAAPGPEKDKEEALESFAAEWKRRILLLEEALVAGAHVSSVAEQRHMQQLLADLQKKMLLYQTQTGYLADETHAGAPEQQDTVELPQAGEKKQQDYEEPQQEQQPQQQRASLVALTSAGAFSRDPPSASLLDAASGAAPSLLAAVASGAAAASCAAALSPLAAASADGRGSAPQGVSLPRPDVDSSLQARAIPLMRSSATTAVVGECSNGEGLTPDSISTASDLPPRAPSDATSPAGRSGLAAGSAETETASDVAACEDANSDSPSGKQQHDQQRQSDVRRSSTAEGREGGSSSSSDSGSTDAAAAEGASSKGGEVDLAGETAGTEEQEGGGGSQEVVGAAGKPSSNTDSRAKGVCSLSFSLRPSVGSGGEGSGSSSSAEALGGGMLEEREGCNSDKSEAGGGAAAIAEPPTARRTSEGGRLEGSCMREKAAGEGPPHAEDSTRAARVLLPAAAGDVEAGGTASTQASAAASLHAEDESRGKEDENLDELLEEQQAAGLLGDQVTLRLQQAVALANRGDAPRHQTENLCRKSNSTSLLLLNNDTELSLSPTAPTAASPPTAAVATFAAAVAGQTPLPARDPGRGESAASSAATTEEPSGAIGTAAGAAENASAEATSEIVGLAAAATKALGAAAVVERCVAAAAADELKSLEAATRRDDGHSVAERKINGDEKFLRPSSYSSLGPLSSGASASPAPLEEAVKENAAYSQCHRATAEALCSDTFPLLPEQARTGPPAAAVVASTAAYPGFAAASAEEAVAATAAVGVAAAERSSRGSRRDEKEKTEEEGEERSLGVETTVESSLREELQQSRKRVLMLEQQLKRMQQLLQQQQHQRETCARPAEVREPAGQKKADQLLPFSEAGVEGRFVAAGCFSVAAAAPFVLPITAIFDGADTFRGTFLMLVHAGAPAAQPTGYTGSSGSTKCGTGGATLSVLAVTHLTDQEKLKREERPTCTAALAAEEAAAQGVVVHVDRCKEGFSGLCDISAATAAAAPALLRHVPLMQVKKVSRVLEYSSRRRLHEAEARGCTREKRQLQKQKQDGGELPEKQTQKQQQEQGKSSSEVSTWYRSFCYDRLDGEHALSFSAYVYRIYFKHAVTVWAEEAAAAQKTKWVSAALEEPALHHLGIHSPEACDRLLLAVLKRSSEFSQPLVSTLPATPSSEC